MEVIAVREREREKKPLPIAHITIPCHPEVLSLDPIRQGVCRNGSLETKDLQLTVSIVNP